MLQVKQLAPGQKSPSSSKQFFAERRAQQKTSSVAAIATARGGAVVGMPSTPTSISSAEDAELRRSAAVITNPKCRARWLEERRFEAGDGEGPPKGFGASSTGLSKPVRSRAADRAVALCLIRPRAITQGCPLRRVDPSVPDPHDLRKARLSRAGSFSACAPFMLVAAAFRVDSRISSPRRSRHRSLVCADRASTPRWARRRAPR